MSMLYALKLKKKPEKESFVNFKIMDTPEPWYKDKCEKNGI